MAAGFEGFEVTWKKNVFEGAASPRKEVTFFGTRGVNFRASRPDTAKAGGVGVSED